MLLRNRVLAVLLVVALSLYAGTAGAEASLRSAWEGLTDWLWRGDETPAAPAVDDWEVAWNRLLAVATEEGPDWYAEEYLYESLTAEEYEAEKLGTPRDYARVEDLYLYGFNQRQFEEILPLAPGLRELSLIDCAVEGFSPLLDVPALESLDLPWSGATPAQLAALAKLPRLPALGLHEVPADADLEALTVLTGLEALELDFERDAVPCNLLPLGGLPHLRSLRLTTWETVAGPLPDLPLLTELLVRADMDLALLRHTPALRSLALGYLPAGTDLSPLATLAGLTELEIIAGTDVDAGGYLPALPPLPNLRKLVYYGDGGFDTVVPGLPDLPLLTELHTNAALDLALLRHTPALRVLSIPGAEDFSPLSRLSALEEIHVEWFLPEDLSPLYALPALRLLKITANHADVTDRVEALEALHAHAPHIEIVLYSCC